MARPKLTVPVHRFHVNLTLREGEEDDLIAFLQNIAPRQRVKAVKMALRTGNLTAPQEAMLPDDEEIAEALADFVL